MPRSYQILSHTADVALRVRGRTLERLFENAARGMFALMVPDLRAIPRSYRHEMCVEAVDWESLLVSWLSDLLYVRDTAKVAFRYFRVRFIAPLVLTGVAEGATGIPFDRPVKAVTFHNLRIEETPAGLITTIVFDV